MQSRPEEYQNRPIKRIYINFDKVDKIRGMDITLVTTSKSKDATFELLKEFNFPLTQTKKN